MSSSPGDLDLRFMTRALGLAREAEAVDEVPVGAVAVRGEQILAEAHNRRELDADPFAHAELLAMAQAARALGRWRLSDVTIYVTLEPCPMCAGAMVNARVGTLVYAARDPKAGAVRSLYELVDDPRLNHRVEVREGVLAEPAGALLRGFFRARRQATKARKLEG